MTDLRAFAPLDRPLADLLRSIGRAARLLARAVPTEDGLRPMLRELGTALSADRALFMPVQVSGPAPEDHRFTVAQEWLRAAGEVASLAEVLGDTPTPFVGEGYDFTRRLELLRVGRPFVYSGAKTLPANEAGFALRLKTQSSVRVPVLRNGRLVAMVGLDHTRTLWQWVPDSLHVLWLVGELTAGVLANFERAERQGPVAPEGVSPTIAEWVKAGGLVLHAPDYFSAASRVLRQIEAMLPVRKASFVPQRPGHGSLAVPIEAMGHGVIGWFALEGVGAEARDLIEPLAELLGAKAELGNRLRAG